MRFLVLVAAALFALVTPAHAQATWTAPSGQFSITFPPSWGVVPEPDRPREVLAHFGQTTTLVERKECYIDVMPVAPFAGMDQASINQSVAGWAERDAFTAMGFGRIYASIQSDSYETANVDGVQVATMRWTLPRNGLQVRTRQRLFILTQDGIAQRFAIHCIALDQVAPMDDIDALLGSLRFPVTQ